MGCSINENSAFWQKHLEQAFNSKADLCCVKKCVYLNANASTDANADTDIEISKAYLRSLSVIYDGSF